MSRLDDLPPDQRATLSLLLRSRKSYADVAALLEIPEQAVRDRAHAALAVLAPAQARLLDAEQREQVGDYMLGQRTGVAERLATRTFLDESAAANAWASALAGELQPLASGALPEIPPARDDYSALAADDASAGAATARTAAVGASAPGTPPSRASSRRAGAVLLGVIAIVVVVVVVLVLSGGGSSKHSGAASASNESSSGSSTVAKTSTSAGTSSTAGTQTSKAKEDKRITLTSPDSSSKAAGVAEVLSEGDQYAFYLAAEHLPPSKGFFYAVWLYNSPTSFEALSRAPAVGSNGSTQGGALLPKDAGKYHTMLLTRETSSKPASPGPIVLRGSFALH
ncbi:MAG TPA: sigma factor-like helix-turn-helix DNA-binding protein [Solirubrobacteraceae bacterium]|jgi:hypothetical protein|nr:sigma factor-like helix-turn-helix DNA-binding protein [Solirubrobacteraceae bacterium]